MSVLWLYLTAVLCSNFMQCQDTSKYLGESNFIPFAGIFSTWPLKWFAIFKTNVSCLNIPRMEKVKRKSLRFMVNDLGRKNLVFSYSFIGVSFKIILHTWQKVTCREVNNRRALWGDIQLQQCSLGWWIVLTPVFKWLLYVRHKCVFFARIHSLNSHSHFHLMN